MISPQDLLERASSKGDIATLLLAGAGTYFGEAALDVASFLEPSQAAVLVATIALGLKRLTEASTQARQRRRVEEDVKQKAKWLAQFLSEEGELVATTQLLRRIQFHERGLIGDDELQDHMKVLIEALPEPKQEP